MQQIEYSQLGKVVRDGVVLGFTKDEPSKMHGCPCEVLMLDGSIAQATNWCGGWIDNETNERLFPIMYKPNDMTRDFLEAVNYERIQG